MAIIQTTLKEFIKDSSLFEKKRKRKPKKKKKATKRTNTGMKPSWYRAGGYGLHNNHYGGDSNMGGDGGGGGGMGESLITELLSGIVSGSFSSNMAIGPAYSKHSNNPEAGMTTYASDDPGDWEWTEEEIEAGNKEAKAQQVFNSMIKSPDVSRQDILSAIMKVTGAAESTAITYYTRFHKGMNKNAEDDGSASTSNIDDDDDALGGNAEDESTMGNDEENSDVNGDPEMELPQAPPEMQEFDDPTKAGVIRAVKNAHLVYKKQTEDGTFAELWIYNVHRNSHDELDIRRDILAGTDIPKTKTRSVDGIQHYTITTMGNAQLLQINGLYN